MKSLLLLHSLLSAGYVAVSHNIYLLLHILHIVQCSFFIVFSTLKCVIQCSDRQTCTFTTKIYVIGTGIDSKWAESFVTQFHISQKKTRTTSMIRIRALFSFLFFCRPHFVCAVVVVIVLRAIKTTCRSKLQRCFSSACVCVCCFLLPISYRIKCH